MDRYVRYVNPLGLFLIRDCEVDDLVKSKYLLLRVVEAQKLNTNAPVDLASGKGSLSGS